MTDNAFKSKISFIVESDGLLKNYLESIVIKNIKSRMGNDRFKSLNINQIHSAMILKRISPCSLKTFAATMRMSKAAASALVDRMVKGGVIQREANPKNRREVLLTVSPDFDAHVSHVQSEMGRWFETLADKMGIETVEKWYDVMVTLNRVLHEEIQTADAEYNHQEVSD